jgi:outer membrane protein insertion porin family
LADLRFEGNAAVSTQAIRERILKLADGKAFSEREFRQILDLNIRPMFEEKGLLAVNFRDVGTWPGSSDGEVLVTTTIEQGRVWRLGKVSLEGDDLPTGSMLAAGNFVPGCVANWKEFLAGVAKMEAALKHDGFIDVSSKPVPTFQSATGLVDVAITVRKGTQYRFASVDITGLTARERREALSLWELKEGRPMDGLYTEKFLNSLFERVHPSKTHFSVEMRDRPGTDQIDVIVAFNSPAT